MVLEIAQIDVKPGSGTEFGPYMEASPDVEHTEQAVKGL